MGALELMDSETLPKAIGELFRLNDHVVEFSVHVHGAEVDIVAKSITFPFAPPIYIEATIEYVGTTKYGKDATKFLLLQKYDPGCICLTVSLRGFTSEVAERAKESGVKTLTYQQLFQQFEKFGPYAESITHDASTLSLAETYEEPYFDDVNGTDLAPQWLTDWRSSVDPKTSWLVILGEYGTGKTALTRVLQYRWLNDYLRDPTRPIPIRIELRNFSRQFDARTLLHHFLDSNSLSHIPIDFVYYLMAEGRIVLLLDGYDEMAQFLNARERRACLAALAELSSQGARGILTSRPNYFSETEEFRIFEALYTSLEREKVYLAREDRDYLNREVALDSMIERYLVDRFERALRDLSAEQTVSLVRRKLADDPAGQEVTLNLLNRIFRDDTDKGRISLSGKPVIIAYLLELIEDLKDEAQAELSSITEWEIYRIIVDRLMLRDQQRAELPATRRRPALQQLALTLSGRDQSVADENTFYKIIETQFRQELRRLNPDERILRREQYFEDLRSSATLTRTVVKDVSGWAFSHNSLREYLCAEYIVAKMMSDASDHIVIPISDAMQTFAAAIPQEKLFAAIDKLRESWKTRRQNPNFGRYIELFWKSIAAKEPGSRGSLTYLAVQDGSKALALDDLVLSRIDLSRTINGQIKIDGSNSHIVEITLRGVDISGSVFKDATIDTCIFRESNLAGTDFTRGFIFETDLTNCDLTEAKFYNIDTSSSINIEDENGRTRQLSSDYLRGYLKYKGGFTDPVDDYYVVCNKPGFETVLKICDRLIGQKNNQLRGLTQRGDARENPQLARNFVCWLERSGMATINHNELVSATSLGRTALSELVLRKRLHPDLSEFFDEF